MIRIKSLFCISFCLGILVPGLGVSQESLNDSFGLAAGHYERNEYELAVQKFRDVIQQHPNTRQSALSYFFLAESLVQMQDHQAAYPAYKIFLERLPQDKLSKSAEFRIGECAYRLDMQNQATIALESFLHKYPDDPLNEYALTYLGELRLQRREPHLALRVFDRALIDFPESINANRNRFGVARALQDLNRHDEAIRFYELITADPTNPLAGQSKLQIGIIKYERSQFDSAKATLQIAIDWMSGDPRLNEARYWLAKTRMAMSDYPGAFELYSEILDGTIDQDIKIAVLFDGALAASKLGQLDTSLAWINRLRKTWPDSAWADDALQLKIELLFKDRNFDSALESITKFETEFSGHVNLPVMLEYRGRIFYDRGDTQQAVEVFDELLNRFAKPGVPGQRPANWRYLKSLCHLKMKQYKEAAEVLDELDVANSGNELKSAVLLAQASSAAGMQLPGKAIKFLQEYLATGVAGASADRARTDLLIAFAQSKQWQQVETLIDDFATQFHDQEKLLETELLIAELALQDHRFDFSERLFRELAAPDHARKFVVRGLSGIAWVRIIRGEDNSAVEVFESLISEFPETPFAAESALVCGKHFEQQQEFERAVLMYQLIQNRFPGTSFAPLAQLRTAYCLTKSSSNADRQQAEKILLEYLETETEGVDEARYQLAWIFSHTGRHDEALQQFLSIAKMPDSQYQPDAAYRIAKWYVDQKQYDQAKPLIVDLQNRDIADEIRTRVSFLAGQLAVEDEDWGQVRRLMESVLDDCDDEELRKNSRYWLAESYFHDKQYADAESQFAKLVSQPKLVSKRRQSWAALRLSQCYAQQQRWTKAMESAIESKKRFRDFEAEYEFDFVIGRSHAAQGRLTEARDSFRQVIHSSSGLSTETAAMAQWRIGETYFHQEKYERAIEAFYKVDSLYGYEKWRAAALVEAGKCQEHLGNWNHAVNLYEQLLDKFPTSEFCQAAKQRLNAANRQAKKTDNVQNK